MAQMVAKAMAKTDVSAADKAMIDKLAAEFADELNNLGVRVSNLEKHADMVKWNGKVEYTYTSDRAKYHGASEKENHDHLLFRLEPTAEVNEHWDVHARLDAATDMNTDAGHGDKENDGDNTVKLKRAWAQGNYKNFTVKVGKFGSDVNNTLVYDDPFSGFGVTFGNQLQATLEAGRIHGGEFNIYDSDDGVVGGKAASYQGIGLKYNTGKLSTKAAYQHFDFNLSDSTKEELRGIGAKSTSDDVGIWSIGANYAFDHNVNFNAEYAKANRDYSDYEDYTGKAQDKSYAFELNYKGAQQENAGTWGAWLAYRYIGSIASPHQTYDAITRDEKGWEIGANYTPFKNIVGTLRYGDTKELDNTDVKTKHLFGRVEFFF